MAEDESQEQGSPLAGSKSATAKTTTTKKVKKSEVKAEEMKGNDPDAAGAVKPKKKKSKSNIVGVKKTGEVDNSAAEGYQDKKKPRRASKSPMRASSKKLVKPKEVDSRSTRSSRSVNVEDQEKQPRRSRSSKSPRRPSSKKKISKSAELDNSINSLSSRSHRSVAGEDQGKKKSRRSSSLSPKRPNSKKLGNTKGELDISNKSPSSRSTRSVKSLASAGDEDSKKKPRRASSSSPKSASQRKSRNKTTELDISSKSPSSSNVYDVLLKPAEDQEETKSGKTGSSLFPTRRSFTSFLSGEDDQEKKKERRKSTLSAMFPRRRSFTSLLSAEAHEKKKARRKSSSSLSPKRANSKKKLSNTTGEPSSKKSPSSTATLEPPLSATDQDKKQSKRDSPKSPRRPSSKKKASAAKGAEIASSTKAAVASNSAPITKGGEAAPLRPAGAEDGEVSSNLSQSQIERPIVYNDPWRGLYASNEKEASSIPLVPSYDDDDDDRRRRNSFFLRLSAAKDGASKKRDIILDGLVSPKAVYCLIGIATLVLVFGAVVGFDFAVGDKDNKLTTADPTNTAIISDGGGGAANAPSSSVSQTCSCYQYKHEYDLSDRRILEKSTPTESAGQQYSDFEQADDIRKRRNLELSEFKEENIRNFERTMVMLTVDFAPRDSQQSDNFDEGSQTRHRHLIRGQEGRRLLQQPRRHLLAEDDHRNEFDDVLIETAAIFWDQELSDENSQLEFSYLLTYCVTDQRILRPNEYVDTIHSNLQEWMNIPDNNSYLLELLTSNGALPSGGNSLSMATRGFNCDDMQ